MKFTFTDMALLPNGTMQDGNLAQAMITFVFLNLVYIFVILVDVMSFVCSKRSINFIKNMLQRLRKKSISETIKIPHHIAIILGVEDLINLPLLSDFIIFAAQAGVRQLTFYDSNGHVLSLFNDLEEFFNKSAKRRLSSNLRIRFIHSENSTASGDLQVYALDRRHGKELLLNICAELSRSKEQIDSKQIQSRLNKSGVHEVDFVIAIGCQNTLHDYPPWSLRLAEILHLRRLDNWDQLSEREFNSMIRAFSCRDRRMGY